jgi:hypothetical protein
MLVPVAGDWQVWGHEYMGPRAFASLVSWLRWQLAVLEPKTPDGGDTDPRFSSVATSERAVAVPRSLA